MGVKEELGELGVSVKVVRDPVVDVAADAEAVDSDELLVLFG